MQSYVTLLSQIPPPPPGKTGWPWTEESQPHPIIMSGNSMLPKISLVTPSYNQGKFLEETIRSVLLQNYANLEYVIIDGGSSDESVDIIKKYESWLTFWTSEPDRGQTHAINKGFDHVSGDWRAWINSDDFYLPGALFRIARTIEGNPNAEWIVGTTITIDCEHREVGRFVPQSSGGQWTDYVCVRQSGCDLPQPSSFWSRKAWLAAGKLDESFHYAMDHEYWGRLACCGFLPLCIPDELASFRRHEEAKSSEGLIPFWCEELRVVDKWLLHSNAIERHALLDCRNFLKSGIRRMKWTLLRSTIGNLLLNPLREGKQRWLRFMRRTE